MCDNTNLRLIISMIYSNAGYLRLHLLEIFSIEKQIQNQKLPKNRNTIVEIKSIEIKHIYTPS